MVIELKLIYHDKAIDLVECKSFFSRFKGFMFDKKIDKCLYFNHCNSIHTFFMKKNIDVILCDRNNTILYYYPNLSSGHIILPKKNVVKVFELPVGYFNFKLNEKVEILL